jgi:hypothetical protein
MPVHFFMNILCLAALYYANPYLLFLMEIYFFICTFLVCSYFFQEHNYGIYQGTFLYAINFLSACYNGEYSRTMLSIACVLQLPLKLHIQENLWRTHFKIWKLVGIQYYDGSYRHIARSIGSFIHSFIYLISVDLIYKIWKTSYS